MTRNEKERLAREIHRDIFRKISKDVHDVVADTINAAIEKRLPEVSEPEADYTHSREGKLWTPDEEVVLRDEMVVALRLISVAHRRTAIAIRSRLQKLGIITDYSLLGL